MDTNLAVAVVAASATMVTGICGMWINASQTGKRIDETGKRIDGIGKRIDDLRADFRDFRTQIQAELKDLRTELTAFKGVVNGKLQAIDFEIAKLMDRPK
jgi:hypothetical protein